mgnify:FL=1
MASTDWFTTARFGMFVHFGIYSGAARHEWVQTNERLTDENYRQYFENFDPDLFDAAAIARTAKQAGMQYAVLTTKHHDGFALWNTALSDFSAQAVCGRDLVAEFVAALRAEGLRAGLYFPLIDWHHPDFTIDWVHPRRDDENAAALNEGRDMSRYREFMHGQLRELLTGYGQIDYLFFDFTYPETKKDFSSPESKEGWVGKSAEDWDAAGLLAMCRELQPGVLINDRLGIPGDFVTPEQYQPTEPVMNDGVPVIWEACQTTNGSWGYHRDNDDHKAPDLLIRMLADSVSMNGNMLLNIGPNGRGAVDARDARLLGQIGEWMRLHERSIVGAGHAPFTPPREGVYTLRGNKLYLHLFSWPMGYVHLPELAGVATYARLLHDGSWLKMSVSDPEQEALVMRPAGQAAGTLTLSLPIRRPDVAMPVIELTLGE